MKLNVGKNTVRNAFTDPANMRRWVQSFEAVDEDHTRRTPWCRLMFTGFKELMSRFTGGNIQERTEGDMQQFNLMVEPDLAGENA
ncbi:MAG: hypothetical protein QGF87_02355 [Woeseiaceae bacterium]|jgi:hypothetical protein|nr:hypothetical protein [Woeseiaceae bacterium]